MAAANGAHGTCHPTRRGFSGCGCGCASGSGRRVAGLSRWRTPPLEARHEQSPHPAPSSRLLLVLAAVAVTVFGLVAPASAAAAVLRHHLGLAAQGGRRPGRTGRADAHRRPGRAARLLRPAGHRRRAARPQRRVPRAVRAHGVHGRARAPVPLRGAADLPGRRSSAPSTRALQPPTRVRSWPSPGSRRSGRWPRAGSFEGQTTLGVGVRARLPFRVFTLAGPGSERTARDRRRPPLVAATRRRPGRSPGPAVHVRGAGRRRPAGGAARWPAARAAGCPAGPRPARGSSISSAGVSGTWSAGSKLRGTFLRCLPIDRTSRTTAISRTTISSSPSGPDLPTSSGSCCWSTASRDERGGHETSAVLRRPANRSSSGIGESTSERASS